MCFVLLTCAVHGDSSIFGKKKIYLQCGRYQKFVDLKYIFLRSFVIDVVIKLEHQIIVGINYAFLLYNRVRHDW